MGQVNIHEAKTHLSRLVDPAAKGEPFVIARGCQPLVKLVAIEAQPRPSWLGCMAGEFTVPDDFDTIDQAEIIQLFAGDEESGPA